MAKKEKPRALSFGQNISVTDANLWYGDFQALKNINIEIPEKRVTAFIGPAAAANPPFSNASTA